MSRPSYKKGRSCASVLIAALLTYVSDDNNAPSSWKLNQDTDFQKLIIEWEKRTPPKLRVKNATLRSLALLIENCPRFSNQPSQEWEAFTKLSVDQKNSEIRNALNCLVQLNLIEDRREKLNNTTRTNRKWRHFAVEALICSPNKLGFEQKNLDYLFGQGEEKGEWDRRRDRSPSSSLPMQSLLPPSQTPKFVGRKQELQELHQKLQQLQPGEMLAIVGMAGIGKTELIKQYAIHYRSEYPDGIFWLEADQDIGHEIVTETQARFGLVPDEDLPLEKRVRQCWYWWLTLEKGLLIIDNVSDVEDQIKRFYLPDALPNLKVVVTTQMKNPSLVELTLDSLPGEDSQRLLTSWIGEERIAKEAQAAQAIHQYLEGLPLALELVGQHLKNEGESVSLQEVANELKRYGVEHPVFEENRRRGLQAAFQLSWTALSAEAQELAVSLSLFAAASIPWLLVEKMFALVDSENQSDDRPYGNWRSDRCYLRNRALKPLKTANLVTEKGTGDSRSLDLHSLVQDFFRYQFEVSPYKKAFQEAFCQALATEANHFPSELSQYTLGLLQELNLIFPHLQQATTRFANYLEAKQQVMLLLGLGKFQIARGRFSEAEDTLLRSHNLAQKCLEFDRFFHLASLRYLAVAYHYQGQLEKAESSYEEFVTRVEQMGCDPEFKTHLANSLDNLGRLYLQREKLGAAKDYIDQAFELRKRIFGEHHRAIASSLNSLASWYLKQRERDRALNYYQEAIHLLTSLGLPQDAHVIESKNGLAEIYLENGQYLDAETHYKEVIDLTKKLRGDRHYTVALGIGNLAGVYFYRARYLESQGKRKQAQHCYRKVSKLYRSVISILQQVRGNDYLFLANFKYNQACALRGLIRLCSTDELEKGDYKQVETLFEEALTIVSQTLGSEHPKVQQIKKSLETERNKRKKR
jgi:tetratricopeptide (TPR) repeat protein